MNTLLVIDDDRHLRMLYVEEFSIEGYSVIAGPGGPYVCSLIREVSPDLLVMEPRMKTCDGLKVLRDIREAFPALPLVLCSASDSLLEGLEKEGAPERALLTKSWDLSRLKDAIKWALEPPPTMPVQRGPGRPSMAPGGPTMEQQEFCWKTSME